MRQQEASAALEQKSQCSPSSRLCSEWLLEPAARASQVSAFAADGQPAEEVVAGSSAELARHLQIRARVSVAIVQWPQQIYNLYIQRKQAVSNKPKNLMFEV